jgi:hypothetical protein
VSRGGPARAACYQAPGTGRVPRGPLGARVGGQGVGEGTGVGGVQWPIPGHVTRLVGLAQPGGQGKGEVDPAGHAQDAAGLVIAAGWATSAARAISAGRAVTIWAAGWAARVGWAGIWVVLAWAGGQQGADGSAGEQSEVDLGAQGIQGAVGSGGLELFGQGGEVGVGGQHRGWRQVPPGQRRRPGRLAPAFDPAFAQRLLFAPARGGGVGGQHRAAGGRPQLPGGQPRRGPGDRGVHRRRVLAGQAGGLISDHLGPGQVDVPGAQRGAGSGQAAQADREVEEMVGGVASER